MKERENVKVENALYLLSTSSVVLFNVWEVRKRMAKKWCFYGFCSTRRKRNFCKSFLIVKVILNHPKEEILLLKRGFRKKICT